MYLMKKFDLISNISFKLKNENVFQFHSMSNRKHSDNQFKKFESEQFDCYSVTTTLMKSRNSPKHQFNSQTIIPKADPSNSLPSNLQNFNQNLLPGNGFMVYVDSSKSSKRFHV